MEKKLLQKPFFWALVIFVAASVFRIFFLDLIEFKGDEASAVFDMYRFFAKPFIFQTGQIQSTGVYNPPLFYFLMIPISFFSLDPQTLSFVIALINTICVSLFYLVIKRFYDHLTAVFASLLIAFSPIPILYSRKIWIPDLLAPFVLAVIYFLHQVVVAKKKKYYFGLFLTLSLMIQMHASGLFLTAATIIILLILNRKKIDYKLSLTGFGLGLLPALPYFYRQVTSQPFCIDCASFIKYQSTEKSFDLLNFIRPLQLLNGSYYQDILGSDYPNLINTYPVINILNIIFLSQALVLLAGAYLIVRFKKKYLFLVILLLTIPGLYLISRTPSYMHYFIMLSYVVALVFGLSFKLLYDLLRSTNFKLVILAIYIIFVSANLLFMIYFYTFLSHKKTIVGDYGPIFPVTKHFVESQTSKYKSLDDYQQIKYYAYLYATTPLYHAKLGEYFAQSLQPDLAVQEFKKAVEVNPNDIASLANLTYILIITKQYDDAKKQLDILSIKDPKIADDLKRILIKDNPNLNL